jgi:acetoin utilization deacetylase AcuC-like enzyme
MTRLVVDAAERHCGGRLLSLLEGGYHPEGLASCIERHVRSLGMGDQPDTFCLTIDP